MCEGPVGSREAGVCAGRCFPQWLRAYGMPYSSYNVILTLTHHGGGVCVSSFQISVGLWLQRE